VRFAAPLNAIVMRLLDLPQEIRILNATTDLVASSVNHLLCCFYKDDHDIVVEVKPKDLIEKKYFYILLLEMIAGVNQQLVPAKYDGDNLLTLIQRIAGSPNLSSAPDNVERLSNRSRQFLDWLSYEFSYNLYSANIGKEICVRLSRKDALYLVGNRCKHSLTRSNAITQKLVRTYRASGVSVADDEEMLLLQDIDNWLFDDFCGYHFTRICEFCSNLYHAIIEYVRPEFISRATRKNGAIQSYDVPRALTGSDQVCDFHELLNRVAKPWIPVIQTPSYLTLRY
jgi:hypothetical protein